MTTTTLPLLYQRPRVLQPALHGRLSLSPQPDYSVARHANALPVLAAEMPGICRQLPIVFTADERPQAVAVLGLREQENLCVDVQGRWCAGSYVPAYLRRYPFIFLEDAQRQELTLCIDEAAPALRDDGIGDRLFDDSGQPGAVTRSALAFCRDYQAHHLLTLELVDALRAADLLTARNADVTLPGGQRLALSGFQVVDEARLERLPDATFLQWRAKGWLPLIYSHLLSVGNWSGLLDRLVQKTA